MIFSASLPVPVLSLPVHVSSLPVVSYHAGDQQMVVSEEVFVAEPESEDDGLVMADPVTYDSCSSVGSFSPILARRTPKQPQLDSEKSDEDAQSSSEESTKNSDFQEAEIQHVQKL